MNIKFKNREELYQFLNTFDYSTKREDELSSVYFLIKYDDCVEPFYFMPFEDVYFESPCALHYCHMNDEELEEYVREMCQEDAIEKALAFEKRHLINGTHYEIDNPQIEPFLNKDFELLDVLSETECLKWMLEREKERK